jgi:pSer/pThr/pTyr-binding forkhead associated (FHA) protein
VKLLVLEGPAARATFDIEQRLTLVGRAPDCDVLVFDAQVSRHHAQILQQGTEFHVQTLQQSNPVIVNDRILTGRRKLQDGDLIVVGGVVFEVDIPPVTQTGPPTLAADVLVIEERRTPRPPALPPPPPREQLRGLVARLAAAAQRVQSRASAGPRTSAVQVADTTAVDAIVAEHERLGGDAELARLAGLLTERLSNQTDIRALYRLSAEASNLIDWSRIAQRSKDEAIHLAEVLGAQ